MSIWRKNIAEQLTVDDDLVGRINGLELRIQQLEAQLTAISVPAFGPADVIAVESVSDTSASPALRADIDAALGALNRAGWPIDDFVVDESVVAACRIAQRVSNIKAYKDARRDAGSSRNGFPVCSIPVRRQIGAWYIHNRALVAEYDVKPEDLVTGLLRLASISPVAINWDLHEHDELAIKWIDTAFHNVAKVPACL